MALPKMLAISFSFSTRNGYFSVRQPNLAFATWETFNGSEATSAPLDNLAIMLRSVLPVNRVL